MKIIGTLKKRMLDPKNKYVDPIMTYPFVIGVKERASGEPKEKNRWLTGQQQRAWEEGWDLMDELLFYKEGPTSQEDEAALCVAPAKGEKRQ